MCGGTVETSRHLILFCDFAMAVWYSVSRWLGLVILIPPEVIVSYCQLIGSGVNKRVKNGYSIVWLAFIWVIWKSLNDRIFNNNEGSVEEAVDLVKRLSWQWLFLVPVSWKCSFVFCLVGVLMTLVCFWTLCISLCTLLL
jgi:hypothetical protein